MKMRKMISSGSAKEYGNFNLQVPEKALRGLHIRILFSNIAMTVKPQKWFLLQIGKSFDWTMKRQNLIQPESLTNVLSKNTRRILMQKNMFQT